MIKHPDASLAYLYRHVDLPFLPVLTEMEQEGVLLDVDLLRDLGQRIDQALVRIKADIDECAGWTVNLGSTQQVQRLLFDQLRLPRHPSRKLRNSADKEVLEWLKDKHLIVNRIREHRKLAKLKEAFVDPLPTLVRESTGRVHGRINNTRVKTGRLSMSQPNFQQLSRRVEPEFQGTFVEEAIKTLRKAVVAPEGCVVLAFDQAQVEFRVMTVLGNDVGTIDAINKGVDIHCEAVAAFLGRPYDEVYAEYSAGDKMLKAYRDVMKNGVYGQAYGQTPEGLYEKTRASGLPITKDQCYLIRDTILGIRPGIRKYIAETKQEVLRDGYVDTYFGRRIWYPEILDPGVPDWLVEKIQREAVNSPIQGTSADITKLTLIAVQRRRDVDKIKARLLLQVHDESVLYVEKQDAERLARMVEEVQPTIVDWPLKITAEAGTGPSWGEAKK